VVTAPARREVVRNMAEQGLSERHALRVIGMSASSLRYRPAPDRNIALRETIGTLAHRHRRYGAGMIYLKLRQRGLIVNHKRVERLYAEANLQIRRRKRKKVPMSDRQPLERPEVANEVCPWTLSSTAAPMVGWSSASPSSMTPRTNQWTSCRNGRLGVSP